MKWKNDFFFSLNKSVVHARYVQDTFYEKIYRNWNISTVQFTLLFDNNENLRKKKSRVFFYDNKILDFKFRLIAIPGC